MPSSFTCKLKYGMASMAALLTCIRTSFSQSVTAVSAVLLSSTANCLHALAAASHTYLSDWLLPHKEPGFQAAASQVSARAPCLRRQAYHPGERRPEESLFRPANSPAAAGIPGGPEGGILVTPMARLQLLCFWREIFEKKKFKNFRKNVFLNFSKKVVKASGPPKSY